MNLDYYDPEKDEVVVTRAGLTSGRNVKSFIESGQVDELSVKDQARLFQMLKDHPYVVADQCTFGSSHSFSLNTQKKVLRLLRLAYMAVVVLCPLVFLGKLEVLGMMLTGGTLFFPLSFIFLDSISELYGQRRARQLVADVSGLLITVGLLGYFWAKLMQLEPVISELASHFIVLGFSLFITDMINIWIFQNIRRMMKNRLFVIRSAVSSVIAIMVFSPIVSFAGYGEFWADTMLMALVVDTTLAKLLLVLAYLPIGVAIVYGTRWWRREYVK